MTDGTFRQQLSSSLYVLSSIGGIIYSLASQINSKIKWRDLKKSRWQLRPRIQAQELLEQTLNAMTAINAGIDQNCSDRAMVQAEIDDLVDYVKSRKAVLELWKERVELLTSEASCTSNDLLFRRER